MDKPSGQTKLRILLLEDVPTDAELVEIALREAGLSFTARRVDTREAFIQALEEFKPDIVLADYNLPAFDGGSAVKVVQQQYPSVPVVMVTGAVGDEKAVELLKPGAKDYILKDRLARLGPAVRRALSEEKDARARKAAEEALLQSEADIKALVEHSPVAMLVDTGIDADEKIMMMNQKFTELFGYTMEDVPDVRHWWPLAYPDEKYREEIRAEWTRRVEQAIQSRGVIEPMEATVACKDGSSRYVKVSLSSIGSRNIITFEDLTERKRTEERIRESEAKFRAIFDGTLDGIVLADVETQRFAFGNPAICRMLGYNAEEITRVGVSDIHPQQDLPRIIEQFEKLARGEIQLAADISVKRKDGSLFYADIKGGSVSFGGKVYLIGIFRDITQHKQMESALKEAADRNRTIMETANDAIICIKPGGIIYLWNHKAEELFGYTAEEASGRELHHLIVPERYHEKALEGLRQFAGNGTGYVVGRKLELTAWHKNRVEFPVEISISSMNIHGEWHATGIIRDITERKQAEARIQKLTRLYATLSQTNHTIVRTTSREDLFCSICKVAVDHGKFALAWVGLVDEATRMVKPACHHGAGKGYLENIVISTDDVPESRGPTGTSIRENCVSYVNDYTTDERALPWREAALKCGLRGAAGVPLRFNGKTIGALTLYADEPDFFDAEQLGLLEEMATDIGFALDNFAREAERKRAEDDLKLQRDNFVRILNAITDGIYIVNRDYEIQYANPAIEREFGKVDGRKCYTYLHDRTELCPWCKNDEVFKGKTVRWEWYSNKTGKYYDLLDTPITNPDGTVSKFEMFHDITERKKTQEAIQAAAQYSRSLIEASQDPLVTISAEGKITDVNIATERVTGVDRAKLIGSDFADYFTDPEKARAGYQQAFSQGFVIDYPLAIRHMSGKVTDVLYNASVYRDGNGNALGVFAAARDITERKQAESRLAEQINELRRWNDATLGREMRILDLKHEVNELLGKSGQPPRYPSAEPDDGRDIDV